MKDKIVVYDLANQRIGWTNYDCSTSVNVSTTTRSGRSEVVDAGQINNNAAGLQVNPYEVMGNIVVALLLHVLAFGCYSVLL
nr:aspartic proteinase-like protein 2 isoform X2 [Ipomoea batatas]